MLQKCTHHSKQSRETNPASHPSSPCHRPSDRWTRTKMDVFHHYGYCNKRPTPKSLIKPPREHPCRHLRSLCAFPSFLFVCYTRRRSSLSAFLPASPLASPMSIISFQSPHYLAVSPVTLSHPSLPPPKVQTTSPSKAPKGPQTPSASAQLVRRE